MQSTLPVAGAPNARAARPERQVSDLVYQGMTIAAMLWLLASLCVF